MSMEGTHRKYREILASRRAKEKSPEAQIPDKQIAGLLASFSIALLGALVSQGCGGKEAPPLPISPAMADAGAKTVEFSTETSERTEKKADYIKAIDQARALLSKSELNPDDEAIIAIGSTDQKVPIRIVKFKKGKGSPSKVNPGASNGKTKVKQKGKGKKRPLRPSITPPDTQTIDGFKITKRTSYEKIYNKYRVENPAGKVVLAVKSRVPGAPEREMIYTPYADQLNTEEVRELGMEYLDNLSKEAVKLAKTRKVPALSGYDWEAFPIDLLIIPVIEHLDHSRLKTKDIKSLMDEVLTNIGTNREATSQHMQSVNKNNPGNTARGLFHITRSTYVDILKRYPQAGLEPNYEIAMEDHLNSALAALFRLDMNLKHLKDHYPQLIKDLNELDLGKLLALTYNGGPGIINTVINNFVKKFREYKQLWEAHKRKKDVNASRLWEAIKQKWTSVLNPKGESKPYVEKFASVWKQRHKEKREERR